MPSRIQWYQLEPGYEVGGPILKDKLWLFSSFIPQLQTRRRTTLFTGSNPGPRELTQTTSTYNAYNRLDYGVYDRLRVFAAWNYGYGRQTGTLGGQDSAYGQRNTGSTTDPNTFRSDAATISPQSTYSFGGDWTPTSKLVINARYGYFFSNSTQRGTPHRHPLPVQLHGKRCEQRPGGSDHSQFHLITPAAMRTSRSNFATVFDAYKRKSWNSDASYFFRFLSGTHTVKGGYAWSGQTNDVLRTYQGGFVTMTWAQEYAVQTGTAVCDAIKAQNLKDYGVSSCQGRYGYFIVGNGVVNTGVSAQTAHGIYIQDAWNFGKGLTLNLGLRFDKETQPPYDPARFPTLKFGWGDKIAPRIGGAYDLFKNGKVKIYGSYGKFYDIMKMGLARGSFGSDYWHNCVYAMDSTDYTKITPTYPIGGGCPATGPAPGVTVGRFIENVDYRATKADPRDPAIQPDMKPMSQHEYVGGVDWAINPNWSLETRYSHKALDMAIEDMAITDNLGFYIGNPGSKFADILHRPVVIPDDSGNDYQTTVPFCAECPAPVPAIRKYDGVEFKLTRRPTGKWFGSASYTYSKLRGNYAGLTNTDPTDGGGGRHSPNNHRAFDIPTMTYLPSGKIDDGPLATDRPNTGKVYGYYRQKWMGGTSLFGFNQLMYQGTPLSTCLPVVGTSSACQWAEGRGNWVNLIRNSDGSISKGSVESNKRTPALFQTDVNLTHEIPMSKARENSRLIFEANIFNLFNQRAETVYYEFAIPTNLINPARANRMQGDLGVDFGKVMNGYNYIDALNGTGTFAGNVPGTTTKIQAPLTLASRYGLASGFQNARSLRLTVRYSF